MRYMGLGPAIRTVFLANRVARFAENPPQTFTLFGPSAHTHWGHWELLVASDNVA